MEIITYEQHNRRLRRLQNKDRKEKGKWHEPLSYYERFLPYKIIEVRPDSKTLVISGV